MVTPGERATKLIGLKHELYRTEVNILQTIHPGIDTDTATPAIRVAIVEDRQEIRQGLATLITNSAGFQCTGSFRTMEEALVQLPRDLPQVVLVDIGLPGMSGIEGIRELKRSYAQLLLLMITIYDDDERIVDAICAGACGYLLKNTAPARLLSALREAVDGGAPMAPEIARRVLQLFRESPPPKKVDYNLTPHEARLLKMLVEGYNYKTAATQLGLSVNTISFHMRHVYEKLQVHSKSEAVAKALRDGVIG